MFLAVRGLIVGQLTGPLSGGAGGEAKSGKSTSSGVLSAASDENQSQTIFNLRRGCIGLYN